MILIDTSVWISHFRDGNDQLTELLNNSEVICHPFVIGELACGTMKNRTEILSLLHALPVARLAEHHEVLLFIENHRLMGRGLGLIDIHLLISVLLSEVKLWTLDRRLELASSELGVNYG